MRYLSNAVRQRAREKVAREERMQRAREEAQRVVATGRCPDCARELRRNLSIAGWWQCSQFGAAGFRADDSQPSCDFQCFTE